MVRAPPATPNSHGCSRGLTPTLTQPWVYGSARSRAHRARGGGWTAPARGGRGDQHLLHRRHQRTQLATGRAGQNQFGIDQRCGRRHGRRGHHGGGGSGHRCRGHQGGGCRGDGGGVEGRQLGCGRHLTAIERRDGRAQPETRTDDDEQQRATQGEAALGSRGQPAGMPHRVLDQLERQRGEPHRQTDRHHAGRPRQRATGGGLGQHQHGPVPEIERVAVTTEPLQRRGPQEAGWGPRERGHRSPDDHGHRGDHGHEHGRTRPRHRLVEAEHGDGDHGEAGPRHPRSQRRRHPKHLRAEHRQQGTGEELTHPGGEEVEGP